jgi:hypothetical protein
MELHGFWQGGYDESQFYDVLGQGFIEHLQHARVEGCQSVTHSHGDMS